jgi:hypothetical protein
MWNKNKLKHPAQAESICTHLYYVIVESGVKHHKPNP